MTANSSHITWHSGTVTRTDRANLLGQRPVALWFTGLSGSGKSTISVAVERRLFELGRLSYRLDGDNIRHGLNQDLGFSQTDRSENIRRVGEVCKLFIDSGMIVLAAAVSPYRVDRAAVRTSLQPGEFIEVYVKCSVETCASRDPKGLYAKAQAGEIADFTGVSAPYEEPLTAELVLDTDQLSVNESVEQVVRYLQQRGHIPST